MIHQWVSGGEPESFRAVVSPWEELKGGKVNDEGTRDILDILTVRVAGGNPPDMAVLAGFVNRIFALPAKLGAMEVLPISPAAGAVLDKIGIWAFFVVIGGFSVWVIGTFFKSFRTLKGEEVPV